MKMNHKAEAAPAQSVQQRLEYLRGELRAERISTGELVELQSLAQHIAPGDVELLEAAGVAEDAAKAGMKVARQIQRECGIITKPHVAIGAPAQSGQHLTARWCPLCGTQHAVRKGEPSPWQPHITRNQIEALPKLIEALNAILSTCQEGVIQRNETGKPQWSALDHMGNIARAALALSQGGEK